MTSVDVSGEPVYLTPHHHYLLPAPPPDRFQPTVNKLGYKLPHPETGKTNTFTRATTISKTLDDTYGLDKWKRRNVLLGLTKRADLVAQIDDALNDVRAATALDGIAEEAQIAAGSAEASEFGTAVHGWLECLDHGRIIAALIPEMYRPHAVEYLGSLARSALVAIPEYTERIVLNTKVNAVGTLDRIYRCADGSLVLGDVKTSKSLEFGYLSFAVQLKIYHGADYMLSLDGTTWEPMPELNPDFAVLMHCPSDAPQHTAAVTFDMAVGAIALDAAMLVRKLRSTAKKAIPNRWATPIPTAQDAALHAAILAIRTCTDPADLGTIWEQYKDVWDESLTDLGNAVAEELTRESNATS